MSLLFVLLKKKIKNLVRAYVSFGNKTNQFSRWFSHAFSRTDLDPINDSSEFLLPFVSAAAILFYCSGSVFGFALFLVVRCSSGASGGFVEYFGDSSVVLCCLLIWCGVRFFLVAQDRDLVLSWGDLIWSSGFR
jgi:hypothetical protein